MDDFDRVGEQWIALDSIQRMFRAIASVFQKTAPPGIMDRFNSSMNAIVHQAYVEGCLAGVRSERARQIISTPQNDDSGQAARLAAVERALAIVNSAYVAGQILVVNTTLAPLIRNALEGVDLAGLRKDDAAPVKGNET